jgi:hypothetical protein
MSFNPLTAPLHTTPAGHVSRENAEQAERDAIRQEILAERAAAANAELEAAVDARIAQRRSTAIA